MIEVNNLSKNFDFIRAVDNINFKIETGEIVGLLGPNGAGKTTTMRMMTGFYHPTKGDVTVDNMSIKEKTRDIQKLIGYLPESSSSYTDMIVADFLNFVANARELNKNERKKGIDRAVTTTSLEKYYYRPIEELSKGYKQRVGLASALIHDPQILILDEPTSGLDPNQIVEIQNLIIDLAEKKTVILSTHILKEVEATCKRAIIINNGQIVLDESLKNLRDANVTKTEIVVKSGEGVLNKLQSTFGSEQAKIETLGSTEFGEKFVITAEKVIGAQIFELAVQNNWVLSELSPRRRSLEEVFMAVTGGSK